MVAQPPGQHSALGKRKSGSQPEDGEICALICSVRIVYNWIIWAYVELRRMRSARPMAKEGLQAWLCSETRVLARMDVSDQKLCDPPRNKPQLSSCAKKTSPQLPAFLKMIISGDLIQALLLVLSLIQLPEINEPTTHLKQTILLSQCICHNLLQQSPTFQRAPADQNP